MAPTIGPLTRTYYSWKALRLPWRKRFFIGHDLEGNTYWEFKLTSSETRLRRIVKYPRSTHLSQVHVSPLWHQWLRHMRAQPPSLEEQQGDVARRQRTRVLAAEADARWEAKPRAVPLPQQGDSRMALQAAPSGAGSASASDAGKTTDAQTKAGGGGGGGGGGGPDRTPQQMSADDHHDVWAAAKKAQGPGERWQPTAWDPSRT
ncbi:hypothetical protein E4U41_002689, partial [Claviceps citrina]